MTRLPRHEGLTAERIRQIVREAFEKRLLDSPLQLARLQPAMRIAAEAVADGDVTAIAPLMKVLDRLDRYQRVAKAVQVYDDEARTQAHGQDQPGRRQSRRRRAEGGRGG